MAVLYLRVSDDISDWIKAQADESGQSIARTAETILSAAKRRGWRVKGWAPEVVEPD